MAAVADVKLFPLLVLFQFYCIYFVSCNLFCGTFMFSSLKLWKYVRFHIAPGDVWLSGEQTLWSREDLVQLCRIVQMWCLELNPQWKWKRASLSICVVVSLYGLRGSVTPHESGISFEWPVQLHGILLQWQGFVCDSWQPRSHAQGSHHNMQDCSGPALTCQKTPAIFIHVTFLTPSGLYGCGGGGFRDGPSCGVHQLMALSTDGSSSSSVCVCACVIPCAQSTV